MGNLDMSGLTPVVRPSTAEAVTSQIRHGIFDGTFQPGAQMREVQLATQLGVSRGPLREALQRLIQDGLLEHRRHRGVFVVRLNQDAVKDMCFVREVVEIPAAINLAHNPSPEAIAALHKLVESMSSSANDNDWTRVAQLDAEFHQTVVDELGSDRLTRMFESIQAETRMCLGALKPTHPAEYDVSVEHRDLLRAVLSADEESITRRWTAHLRATAATLTRCLTTGGFQGRT
jgi:DNA-binding GntR family transcriptional regulator